MISLSNHEELLNIYAIILIYYNDDSKEYQDDYVNDNYVVMIMIINMINAI